MMESHLIKPWSRTQHNIALSSGETELYSATTGSSEALGLVNLLTDMGEPKLQVKLHIDASATKSAITRRGTGRMKHIETQHLWIQQSIHNGRIKCLKIPRSDNFSDMLTHHWSRTDGDKYLNGMGLTCP